MRRALFVLLLSAAACLLVPGSGSAQQEPQCFGENATIVGTPGPDRLVGTSQRDVILALGGDDVVYGRGGNDIICGDTGKDKLYGGDGDDILHKESGGGLYKGGRGNDQLYGGLGDDVMYGGPGPDYMQGGNSDDEDFNPGKDRMFGGSGGDVVNGGLGDDLVSGGPGDDDVEGGVGNFSDRISGDAGNDFLGGSFGDDTLSGGTGADHLNGYEGNDTLNGGSGDDLLEGDLGDDSLYGEGNNDRLLGGQGNDRLFGGPGDDFLNGGPGDDLLDGGSGNNQLVDNDTLSSLIAAGDRAGIRDWAAGRTIAQLNSEVAALTAAERDQLAEVLLDTNATGESRDKMLRVYRAVLAVPELGFYAEIWSYTFIELSGGGFFGTCNHVFLSPDAWGGLGDQDARNVLMHESFHSFNCVNGGPPDSLNEGSAIWILKAPYDQPLIPGESFAEATYGTKLYYRDINNQPDYLLEAASNPTQKLIDVYNYMSAHDPSQLPWNSTERLQTCFNRYFVDLNRNVDFFNVWLPAVKERTDLMLADPECKPL